MISTRGRYALRMLADIAREGKAGVVRLCDVAARQQISEKYLQHIAKQLVGAGILVGTSGRGGGYRLSRPAHEITVLEALVCTEGTLAPVACLVAGAAPCEREPHCATLPLWREYARITQHFFGGVTIADIADGTPIASEWNGVCHG